MAVRPGRPDPERPEPEPPDQEPPNPARPDPARTDPGPGDSERRDPGLQPERTRLAWRRTTLSCAVVALLAVRQAVRDGGGAAGLTAGALSALVWLGFLAVAHRRLSALAVARPPRLAPRAAIAVSACCVLLALCAVTVLG